MMIPYSRQTIDENDIRAVAEVLKSDYLTRGPKVPEFESDIARYTGAKFAVVFSSGTAALHAAYFAAGIGKGDEVITTPLTFVSTASSALWQGAKIVFADVDIETGNIDPEQIKRKITKKTKAIVAVDYAGLPADLDELKQIAREHKLLLIEDAAHALGSEYKGKKIGNIADMTMFSFHPVKSITTGEGGAITTNRKDFYDRLVSFREYGITKDPKKFNYKSHGEWYSEMQELGLNYRMTDIQAALGITQLKKLDKFIGARRAIASRYQKKLSNNSAFILPKEPSGFNSSWHLYPARLNSSLIKKRSEFFTKLRKAEIFVQVHYLPVYWHPYFQKLGYKKGLCPNAEKFYLSEISIPIFPNLSIKNQDFIISKIKEVIKSF